MSKKVVDRKLPKKKNMEDKLFNLCVVRIEEFMEFVTKFRDIEGPFHEKLLSNDYSDLELDNVSIMANGDLVNVEHHSSMSDYLFRRDFQYLTSLALATGRCIHPFIFNTGKIPKKTVKFASPTSFYNPVWVNTQEIEESVTLNNIKYKIHNNDEINVFDVLDMVWVPKYRSDSEIEDIIVELVDIYNQIIVDEEIGDFLRTSLILWAGKFVSKEENKKKVIEGLDMSAQEVVDLSKDIVNARIEGMLYRAEEAGIKKGKKELRSEIVTNLLGYMSPEEIALKTNIPLDKILEIKNNGFR
jgi:hypothetical protein